MAKIISTIDSKSILTLDKSFSRANGQPLDSTQLYMSRLSADNYAKTNAAYVGQIITVIEDTNVTHYTIVDEAGTLKELVPKSDTGTKTYESLEQAKDDLSNLSQGQIITIVNEGINEVYLVGFRNQKLIPVLCGDIISGGTAEDIPNIEINVIEENIISDILNNSYETSGIVNEYAISKNDITNIINGQFSGPTISEGDISEETINDIIDGGLED